MVSPERHKVLHERLAKVRAIKPKALFSDFEDKNLLMLIPSWYCQDVELLLVERVDLVLKAEGLRKCLLVLAKRLGGDVTVTAEELGDCIISPGTSVVCTEDHSKGTLSLSVKWGKEKPW